MSETEVGPGRTPVRDLVRQVPEVLPLACAVMLTCAGLLVVLERLSTVLGVVAAAVSLLVALLLRPRVAAGPVLPSLLVVAGAGGWVLASRPYLTTELLLGRDPAVYSLSAGWLVDHETLRVPVGDGAGVGPNFMAVADGVVVPVWTHAMPAVAGLVGRAFGLEGALGVNLLLGAAALLATFCLARRLVSDWTALVVTAGFAASLPLVHFSRGMYSEIAVTGPGLLAVALLVSLVRSWSRRTAVAMGLALGATATGRIDGLLTIAVLLPLLVLAARLLAGRGAVGTLGRLGLVVLGAAPGVAVGQVDLWVWSTTYVEAHRSQFEAVASAAVAGLVLAAVLAVLPGLTPTGLGRLLGGRRVSASVAGVVGAVTVLVLSRPLWDVSRQNPYDNAITENVQAVEGMFPLDGYRTYEEQIWPWLAAYLGWPTVLAGLGAMVVGLAWGLRRRDAGPVVVASVLLVFLCYLSARSSITPDNIWAMRRFVPQLLPITLVLAGLAVDQLYRQTGAPRVVAVLLAGSVVYVPLLATVPLFDHTEGGGGRAVVDQLCGTLAGSDVVVAGDDARVTGTLRVFCGSEVWVETSATPARLAAARRGMGGVDVLVVSVDPEDVPWRQVDVLPPPTVRVEVERLERTLEPPPKAVTTDVVTYWVGVVGVDGRVDAVPPLVPPPVP